MSKETSNTPAASNADKGGEVLIETTVLGMSPEQMVKSNPAAVAELQQKARDEAVAADRKRSADLKAAFPDDAAFAMSAYEKGQTVAEAKAERHDVLVKENAALKKENGELKVKAEQGTVEFAAADKDGKPAVELSADQVDAKALAYWNSNEKVRTEFGGHKEDFIACYKHEPEQFPEIK